MPRDCIAQSTSERPCFFKSSNLKVAETCGILAVVVVVGEGEVFMADQPSVAIVTGYSSGLGESITERLLQMGWRVVGVSRSSTPANLHSEFPDQLLHVMGSVAKEDTAQRAFERAGEFGHVKLVVNCAGQGVFGEIGTYSAEDIEQVLEGNLFGVILFSDYAVRAMRDTGGDIVNVISTAGKKLRAAESAYCGAKWGAKGYTRTLREAVKAQKLPIRVFEIYPSGMNTPFWSEAVRPVTTGQGFPSPEPIADAIIRAVSAHEAVYTLEITFERS